MSSTILPLHSRSRTLTLYEKARNIAIDMSFSPSPTTSSSPSLLSKPRIKAFFRRLGEVLAVLLLGALYILLYVFYARRVLYGLSTGQIVGVAFAYYGSFIVLGSAILVSARVGKKRGVRGL
jgi:hypothetical protein